MSTYYYFHCAKHQVSGGCWTRQAWGYGNADLIDAFKFVMYHVSECGPDNIGMHSEHNDDDYANTSYEDEHRRQHLLDTAHIMPHSDDWSFMEGAGKGKDWKEKWVEQQLGEINT